MGKFFSKYDYFLYFIVAILSLIAFLARHSTIWLVLFFGWLSIDLLMLQEKAQVVVKKLAKIFLCKFFTLIEILSILLQNFCYYLFEHLD